MKEKALRYCTVLVLLSLLLIYSNAFASEQFYTIQAGTYSKNKLSDASKHFAFLSEELKGEEKEYLRIEEGKKYFIVRVGQYEAIDDAQARMKTITLLVPDAFILKETDFEKTKIVMMHSSDEQKPAFLQPETATHEKDRTVTGAKPVPEMKPAVSEKAPSPRAAPLPPVPTKQEMVNLLIDRIAGLYDNQEYEKAAEVVREGLQRWPDEPDLLAWYGATLLDSGFPDKAYEQYRKATELLPEEPDLHAGLGHSLLDMHVDTAMKSIASFKQALEIDPNNVSALEGLGIAYVSIDKKTLAKEIHDRLQQLDQDAAARLHEFIAWGINWGEE